MTRQSRSHGLGDNCASEASQSALSEHEEKQSLVPPTNPVPEAEGGGELKRLGMIVAAVRLGTDPGFKGGGLTFSESGAQELAEDVAAILSQRSALLEALRPFAAIKPSSLYPEDGREGEDYIVMLRGNYGNPAEFDGRDLARARFAALSSEAPPVVCGGEDGSAGGRAESEPCGLRTETLSELESGALYYAKGSAVWKRPVSTPTPGGKSVTLGFRVCTAAPEVGDEGAETIAALLTMAERYQSRADAREPMGCPLPGGCACPSEPGSQERAAVVPAAEQAGGWEAPEAEEDDGEVTVRAFHTDKHRCVSLVIRADHVLVTHSTVGEPSRIERLARTPPPDHDAIPSAEGGSDKDTRDAIARIVRESVNEALAAAGVPVRCDAMAPITLTKADQILALLQSPRGEA